MQGLPPNSVNFLPFNSVIYTVVIQAWDIRPGNDFILKMDEAAQEAEKTLAVLSENYLTSAFGRKEWAAAMGDDPEGKAQKLIPIRVGECQPT